MGMQSSKINCLHRWRNSTYQCGAANYPVSWVTVYSREWKKRRNFGPTNPHGAAYASTQFLNHKEATGMESSKMYYPSRCRNSTYQWGAANYTVSWVEV